MADVALALLELAVKNLYTVYKSHKDLKRELREVGNFLVDLRANSPILNAKSGRLNHVKNTLRRKLESASKQVTELSSTNLDFFHSDERLRKIQDVRQMVKKAMEEADSWLQVIQIEIQEEVLRHIRPKPAKDAAPPAKRNDQHPKPHHSKPGAHRIPETSPRSKSTPGRAVLPSKPPPSFPAKRPQASTPRRDKTVELYVPMDSEKQARDVVEILKKRPGVKDVISDQTTKQVSVVPLKGVTLITHQLLKDAHLENKSVKPTLWSERPR